MTASLRAGGSGSSRRCPADTSGRRLPHRSLGRDPGLSPAPMPGPVPVPEPSRDPLPCDSVGGPGGASMAPGRESCAAASAFAGIINDSIGFGLVSWLAVLRASAASRRGPSACRGRPFGLPWRGSFIRLPPPPPPPPGPGSLNQIMLSLGTSRTNAATGAMGWYRVASTSRAAATMSTTADVATANVSRLGSRAERERHVDQVMTTFHVDTQMAGGCVRAQTPAPAVRLAQGGFG